MDSEEERRSSSAVAADTNPSNLWQRMVKTVRDVDTRKVMDTKEDIDTLLVFAGLFSAVVTTFVVDSYASLQPDSTDELVFLMRHSLAQNYTLVDGTLRPVAPFPVDPPFEVPVWALRVNGLWFASLIVSLSTASFGMLVKQWLTEYLAMEWISPEEQLRARQYRHPGLNSWRVFEIAATLPLLLHLSLGLFFLGLCFYTAAASEIVGRSTFPLVAGWAFFALLTIIAPLASPRCPYKVTLLKSTLHVGRKYLRALWRVGGRYLRLFKMAKDRVTGTRPLTARSAPGVLSLGLAVFVLYAPFGIVRQALTPVFIVVQSVLRFLLVLIKTSLASLFRLMLLTDVDNETDDDEEDEVVKQDYATHELLLSVDEVIINDGPMLRTMSEVLRQTETPPASIITFVLGCIHHRVNAINVNRLPAGSRHVRGLLNLRALSESAWRLLLELVGQTLDKYLQETPEASNDRAVSRGFWHANAAAVLLSDSWRPLPRAVALMLSDPSQLSRIIQLVRPVVKTWALQDVIGLLWIAYTSPSRTSANISSAIRRDWRRLRSRQTRTLGKLQIAVAQVLLETIWQKPAPEEDYAEATVMLLSLLHASNPHTPSPNDSDWREDVALPMPRGNRASWSPSIQTPLSHLRVEYLPLSSKLSNIVGGSSLLATAALNVYTIYLKNSLLAPRTESLWRLAHNMTERDLEQHALRPIFHDLWRFLLKCARSVAKQDDDLPTYDFVRLCLALARPGVPRVFGRPHPAHDWEELLPVLRYAADGKPLAHNSRRSFNLAETLGLHVAMASDRQDDIPSLAKGASERLITDDADVPDQLRLVLGRLAKLEAPMIGHRLHRAIIPHWHERPSSESDRRLTQATDNVTVAPTIYSTQPSTPITLIGDLHEFPHPAGNASSPPLTHARYRQASPPLPSADRLASSSRWSRPTTRQTDVSSPPPSSNTARFRSALNDSPSYAQPMQHGFPPRGHIIQSDARHPAPGSLNSARRAVTELTRTDGGVPVRPNQHQAFGHNVPERCRARRANDSTGLRCDYRRGPGNATWSLWRHGERSARRWLASRPRFLSGLIHVVAR
ncbi:hypothetical protein PsYK624_115310 [Phanerochaete sordida]|uniref:DUF6535 domain-containing protein n=1 Tax=Phanerochaete sordida TaxID=48140 RepID=A0A9P3GGT5_9APHY|nr:hypothetical protein PsYK624_115310 [Phanerochaete sordida]